MSDDAERRSPNRGGCWVCKTGNGNTDDDMEFDMEFDTFVHPACLEEHGVESVTEYERMKKSESSGEDINSLEP